MIGEQRGRLRLAQRELGEAPDLVGHANQVRALPLDARQGGRLRGRGACALAVPGEIEIVAAQTDTAQSEPSRIESLLG